MNTTDRRQTASPATPKKNSEKAVNGSNASMLSTGSASGVIASGRSASEKIVNGSSTASVNASSTSTFNSSVTASAHEHSSSHSEYVYTKTETYDEHAEMESLGNILSEVPWMKFRVVAEPDMAIFMKDQRIQALIQSITNHRVTIVKKQIMVEFQETVKRTVETLMKEMTKIVDTNMTSVETSVASRFASMSSLKTVSTATVCQTLGKDSHLCTCHHHHDHEDHCHLPVPAYPGSPLHKPPVLVSHPTFDKAQWIWSKEAKDHNKAAPGGARPFRKTLQLESHADMVTIDITCDNFYTLYVNGKLVGSGKEWWKPDTWTVRVERTKKVVIAVYAVQDPVTLGAVGLLVSGKAWNSQETLPHAKEFVSDKTWTTLSSSPIGDEFVKPEFVDSLWEPAHEVKKFGDSPWESLVKTKPEAGRLPKKNLVGIEGVKESPIPKAGVADLLVLPART